MEYLLLTDIADDEIMLSNIAIEANFMEVDYSRGLCRVIKPIHEQGYDFKYFHSLTDKFLFNIKDNSSLSVFAKTGSKFSNSASRRIGLQDQLNRTHLCDIMSTVGVYL